MCLDLSLFYFVLNFIEYSFLVQWFHIIFFFKNAFLEIFRPMSRVWRNEITKCCETRIVLSALYKGGGALSITRELKTYTRKLRIYEFMSDLVSRQTTCLYSDFIFEIVIMAIIIIIGLKVFEITTFSYEPN